MQYGGHTYTKNFYLSLIWNWSLIVYPVFCLATLRPSHQSDTKGHGCDLGLAVIKFWVHGRKRETSFVLSVILVLRGNGCLQLAHGKGRGPIFHSEMFLPTASRQVLWAVGDSHAYVRALALSVALERLRAANPLLEKAAVQEVRGGER